MSEPTYRLRHTKRGSKPRVRVRYQPGRINEEINQGLNNTTTTDTEQRDGGAEDVEANTAENVRVVRLDTSTDIARERDEYVRSLRVLPSQRQIDFDGYYERYQSRHRSIREMMQNRKARSVLFSNQDNDSPTLHDLYGTIIPRTRRDDKKSSRDVDTPVAVERISRDANTTADLENSVSIEVQNGVFDIYTDDTATCNEYYQMNRGRNVSKCEDNTQNKEREQFTLARSAASSRFTTQDGTRSESDNDSVTRNISNMWTDNVTLQTQNGLNVTRHPQNVLIIAQDDPDILVVAQNTPKLLNTSASGVDASELVYPNRRADDDDYNDDDDICDYEDDFCVNITYGETTEEMNDSESCLVCPETEKCPSVVASKTIYPYEWYDTVICPSSPLGRKEICLTESVISTCRPSSKDFIKIATYSDSTNWSSMSFGMVDKTGTNSGSSNVADKHTIGVDMTIPQLDSMNALATNNGSDDVSVKHVNVDDMMRHSDKIDNFVPRSEGIRVTITKSYIDNVAVTSDSLHDNKGTQSGKGIESPVTAVGGLKRNCSLSRDTTESNADYCLVESGAKFYHQVNENRNIKDVDCESAEDKQCHPDTTQDIKLHSEIISNDIHKNCKSEHRAKNTTEANSDFWYPKNNTHVQPKVDSWQKDWIPASDPRRNQNVQIQFNHLNYDQIQAKIKTWQTNWEPSSIRPKEHVTLNTNQEFLRSLRHVSCRIDTGIGRMPGNHGVKQWSRHMTDTKKTRSATIRKQD